MRHGATRGALYGAGLRRLGILLGFVSLLDGCAVGPNFRAPPQLSGAAPPPPFAGKDEAAYEGLAPLPAHWWRLYEDSTLDALEEKALAHNTDLRTALASLEQARSALRGTELQRTPQTTLTIDPTYGQASGDADGYSFALKPAPVYDAMESVTYDLDLFGRLRRAIQEGRANVGAAQAVLDLTRINVAAATAAAYASVCSAGSEIAVTNRSIGVAHEALDVTQRRFNAGIAGINDVVQSRTLLRQTNATLPALLSQQRSALYMLATLTGDPPENLPAAAVGCTSPLLIRKPIPIGDGAGLLARRPDVRQSEQKLAAAVAGIGLATAALYPSITLGAAFGTTATSVPDIARERGFHWDVGPLITWNFPNLSIARTQVAQANAAARGALAAFDGTVLTALRETETDLTTLARQLDTERELAAARDDAALANANIARLYAGGIGAFQDTLDAERTLIGAENDLVQATAKVSQDQITLFMALGGGWQEAPAVDETSLTPVTDRTH